MSLHLLLDNLGTVTEAAGTSQVQAAYMKFLCHILDRYGTYEMPHFVHLSCKYKVINWLGFTACGRYKLFI
jgi:hypothetical protein